MNWIKFNWEGWTSKDFWLVVEKCGLVCYSFLLLEWIKILSLVKKSMLNYSDFLIKYVVASVTKALIVLLLSSVLIHTYFSIFTALHANAATKIKEHGDISYNSNVTIIWKWRKTYKSLNLINVDLINLINVIWSLF